MGKKIKALIETFPRRLPKLSMPKISMPKISMPKLSRPRISDAKQLIILGFMWLLCLSIFGPSFVAKVSGSALLALISFGTGVFFYFWFCYAGTKLQKQDC